MDQYKRLGCAGLFQFGNGVGFVGALVCCVRHLQKDRKRGVAVTLARCKGRCIWCYRTKDMSYDFTITSYDPEKIL